MCERYLSFMSSYISFNLPYPFLLFLATIIKYVIMVMKESLTQIYSFILYLVYQILEDKLYLFVIFYFFIIYYLSVLNNSC